MKPNAMIRPTPTVITLRIANWIHTDGQPKHLSTPEVVGGDQRLPAV